MPNTENRFVWYELMTTDPDASEAFYRHVVGWRTADAGIPDRRYTILSVGETPTGGLMALPDEARDAGGRPGWIGYVGVDDVDAFAERVKQAGGRVHRSPDDIPGVGRFAVVADPHGAAFVLFKGGSAAQPEPPAPATPGGTGWHELHAGDREKDFAFYAGLFGWTITETIDMGPMGVYQTFRIDDAQSGGTMSNPAEAPFWLYYFNVDDIQAAAARVKEHGGQVVNGPHEVPGGSWIVNAVDPQGAAFALVEPKLR